MRLMSGGEGDGLVLKLFPSNLIEMRLANPDKVGTKIILAKDVMAVLSKYSVEAVNGETYKKLRIQDPDC